MCMEVSPAFATIKRMDGVIAFTDSSFWPCLRPMMLWMPDPAHGPPGATMKSTYRMGWVFKRGHQGEQGLVQLVQPHLCDCNIGDAT